MSPWSSIRFGLSADGVLLILDVENTASSSVTVETVSLQLPFEQRLTFLPHLRNGIVFNHRLPQLPVHLSSGEQLTVLIPARTLNLMLADSNYSKPLTLQARFQIDGQLHVSSPVMYR
jgi:hypothetical protein